MAKLYDVRLTMEFRLPLLSEKAGDELLCEARRAVEETIGYGIPGRMVEGEDVVTGSPQVIEIRHKSECPQHWRKGLLFDYLNLNGNGVDVSLTEAQMGGVTCEVLGERKVYGSPEYEAAVKAGCEEYREFDPQKENPPQRCSGCGGPNTIYPPYLTLED